MDLQAIAESMTELYLHCEIAIENRLQIEQPPSDIVVPVFEQSAKVYMTQLINQRKGQSSGQTPQRRQQPQQQQQQYNRAPRTQVQCEACGNNLTLREKEFCDQNGTNYICYKCAHGQR